MCDQKPLFLENPRRCTGLFYSVSVRELVSVLNTRKKEIVDKLAGKAKSGGSHSQAVVRAS